MKKLYTTNDVARILGYHPEYVRQLVRDGKLKRYNATGHYRFVEEDIKEFLERGKEK